ncbi:MAG: hypothetical protein PHE29_03680, partial [Tissierellia bacterium]|nr:hypothetical protein [Tissierellia bacterium]
MLYILGGMAMVKNISKWIVKVIIMLCVFIIISIPIIIYIYLLMYKKLIWVVTDFAEAYMTYFGTVFLGFIALYQNVRLNKENRKIRNFERIEFLSFIKCSFTMEVPAATDFYEVPAIFFEDNTRESMIYINGTIKNVSKYPIDKINGEIFRNGKSVGQKKIYESYNFYLEPGEETSISLLIYILENNPDVVSTNSMPGFYYKCVYSEDKFDYLIKDNVYIILTFTNVFGNETKGKISFKFNEPGAIEITTRFELERICLD